VDEGKTGVLEWCGSALLAADVAELCAPNDALGAEKPRGVLVPSQHGLILSSAAWSLLKSACPIVSPRSTAMNNSREYVIVMSITKYPRARLLE
jgi:hypothetical protein